MASTKATLARRACFTAKAMTGDLHTALLEAYWIIDVMPSESMAIDNLKESITDSILSGKDACMEQALDEAKIAIGSELQSAFAY
ncbi:MAG: hypothetical protein P8Y71_27990 [Pseudolabrys sp.]